MYNQERNNFIQKFRKEQGLDPVYNKSTNKVNMSQISSKTNPFTTTNNSGFLSVNKSKSKGTLTNVMNTKKYNLDKSQEEEINNTSQFIINNNNFNNTTRRWDYLHQLEKVKQAKLEYKKQKQQQEQEMKTQQECTFSPVFYTKLNKSKSKAKYSNNNRNSSSGKIRSNINIVNEYNNYSCNNSGMSNSINNLHTHSKVNDLMNSDSIMNNNIVKYNNNTENKEFLNCGVNQRTEMWIRKKANKTESMKQQLINKEIEECHFKPKLNNYIPDSKGPIEDKVVDSEAFRVYVTRVRKLRATQEEERKRSKSKPGSGNCWKKGITISEAFNFNTEKKQRTVGNQTSIKSLNKPIMLNKYNVNNNYNPGDHRLHTKNYNELETEVMKSQEICHNENKICITNQNSDVRIEKAMSYDRALEYLHTALITLDI